MNIMKKTGFTLIETLIAVFVAGVALTGVYVGSTNFQKFINDKAVSKDITTLLKSVDTRVSIDGYTYSFWAAGESVSGFDEIAPFLLKTFVSKYDTTCGQSDGWEPKLDSEQNKNFIGCTFWQEKLPLGADIEIKTTSTPSGFLESFNIYLDPPLENTTTDGYKERFNQLINTLKTLEKNDYANKNGLNSYKLVNKSNDEILTRIECISEQENCVLKASWNKHGFHESLKTDGSNSMISSNVSFIYDRLDHDEIKSCLLWEEENTNVWASKEVECGIGLYSIAGTETPVTVHLNIEDPSTAGAVGTGITATDKVVLDRLCDVYTKNGTDGIIVTGNAPCGLIANSTSTKVIQYLDKKYATNMYVSDALYATAIENVDVIDVALNLYNNLSDSTATLNTLTVSKTALLENSVQFIKSLNIGDTSTVITTDMLDVDTLNAFGISFVVNEESTMYNVLVDDQGNSPDIAEVVQVLNTLNDPLSIYDVNTKFYISNSDAKVDEECTDKSFFTIQKDTGVVLTCRNDWQDSTKLTWQSNYYGEIGVFQDECPSGWNQIEDIHSRFMIGSGVYSETFMPAVAYGSRDKGGLANVVLEIDQMPEHEHATPKLEHICDACHRGVAEEDCPAPYVWYSYENRCVYSQGLSKTDDGSAVFTNDSERKSTYIGSNKGHENRPNYLAVNYCVYAAGDGLSPGITSPEVEPDNWVSYDSEISGWMDDDVKKFYNCEDSYKEYSPEESLWYTLAQCWLDQYQLEVEREQNLTTGEIRYSGVENYSYQTIVETQVWKEIDPDYTEWVDVGDLYDCTDEELYFDSSSNDYYMVKDCKQDQERVMTRMEQDIRFGDTRAMEESTEYIATETEYQTIDTEIKRKVASASFSDYDSDDLVVIEGDSGETKIMKLTISLNKAFDEEITYRINTQDITTTSILSTTENIVYDQYGNPFISVVDNENGGRLIFDGGFPKYYNKKFNDAKKFSELEDQFIFLYNIVNWISEEHSSRGKILLYGDRNTSDSRYRVTHTGNNDFKTVFSTVIDMAGYDLDIKTYEDFGGTYNSTQSSISLDEMNEYSSIIIMSSGHWESLTDETANNFSTYVNNGGGIYIVTDHNTFQLTGNQVLEKFGSQFYGNVNRSSENDAYKLSTIWSNLSGTEYNKDHILWNGFSSDDYIYAGGSEGNVQLYTPIQDYIGYSEDLVFKVGETEKTIEITINGDDLEENDETFKIILSNPDTGIIIGNTELIATIIDDDSGTKSLSTICSTGSLVDGECIETTTYPLIDTYELVETTSSESEGTIKARYDEYGEMYISATFNDYSFTQICNGESLNEILANNKLDTSETGDTKTETEITSLTITNTESWTTSQSFKDTFQILNKNCEDFKQSYDYNLDGVATLKTSLYESVLVCEDGVLEDGECVETIVVSPTVICLGNYLLIDGVCEKI